MNLIYKYKKVVIDLLFLMLIVFTVLNFNIVNVSMVLLLLIYFYNYKQGINLIKAEKNNILIILFGIFTFFVILNGLMQSNFSEKRYGLLILTFLTFFISKLATRKIILLRSFVISSFGVVLFGIVSLIYYFFKNKEFTLTVGGHINKILYLERPYLGFLCLIATFISFYLYRIEKTSFWKKTSIFLMFIFIIYPFVISARMAILSLGLIGIIYFLFYLKLKKRFKFLIGIAVFTFVVAFLFFNASLTERFAVLLRNQENIELVKDKDPRMIIWPCALDIAKKPDFNVLFGMSSTKELTDKLVECYSQDFANLDRRSFFIKSKFNTHNQYLDLYLTNGLVGIILFISIIFVALVKYRKVFPIFAMWCAFACFCLTENIFYRQVGFYLLILIICFSEWIFYKKDYSFKLKEN